MATLSLALLGPFAVTYGGQVVAEFRTRSVQALLAYLAVEETGSRPRQRDTVAELLWPGYPPGSARKNLRQTLYELGRLLPEVATRTGPPAPFTLASRDTLQINPDCHFELDTATFTRLVQEGSVDALKSAVDLYRGDFLEDFVLPDSADFETWSAAWRGRFQRQALETMDRLAGIALRQHDYAEAESYARRQLALDNLRETAVGQLMQALVGQGQRSAALIAYDEVRQRLDEELGVEPTRALNTLWEQIRLGQSPSVAAQPVSVPAPSIQTALTKPAHNLPAPVTPFIGRDAELEQIQRTLVDDEDCRLLTLLGPGGSGKTRLALQAAANLAKSASAPFVDGVWFVPLAPVQRPEEVVHVIGGVLHFSFLGGDPAARQLIDFLRPRRLLLLLDNLEQLVGEKSGAFLTGLLQTAPGVKLLVTSRARLQLAGETVFPVPGLTVPPEEASAGLPEIGRLDRYEGVRLFSERARRMRPDFALSAENGAAVANICRLVSGMPLAIELAASWAGQLEPEEIAAEIARSLDFLETDQYDLPPRQRSLRAVFATSWQMLSEEEKRTINGLSYFAGPVSREAAAEVAGAGLRQLGALLSKSWLTRDDDGRYALHPLLRHFASERLWADPEAGQAVAEAHHEYYLRLASRLAKNVRGPQQVESLALLTRELADLRATWSALVQQGRLEPVVSQLLPALFHQAEAAMRGEELVQLLEEALAQAAESHLRAILLTARCAFGLVSRPIRFEATGVVLPAFRDYAEEAWSLVSGEKLPSLGMWGTLLTFVYGSLVDRETAVTAARRVAETMKRKGGDWEKAQALYYLAWLIWWVGPADARAETATIYARQAVALFQAAGDRWEASHALSLLARLTVRLGRYDEAIRLSQEAKRELVSMGDLIGAASIDWDLGDVYLLLGQVQEALRAYQEHLEMLESAGQWRAAAYVLSKLSLEASRYGTLEHARAARQRALDLAQELGDDFTRAWSTWEMGEVYRLEGDPLNARLWYDRALGLFAAINDPHFPSFYHRGLGDLALGVTDYAEARQQFSQSLLLAESSDHSWMQIYAKNGLVQAQLGLGEEKEAWSSWRQVLVRANLVDFRAMMMNLLATGAALYAACGKPVRAAELASFVAENPVSWHEARGRAAEVLAQTLPLLGDEADAAQERGRRFQLQEILDVELSRHDGGSQPAHSDRAPANSPPQ